MVASLFLAACSSSGSDDGTGTETPATSTPDGATSTSPDATAPADDQDPINGPLVFVSGLGLFAVDRADGSAHKYAFTGVEGAAINVEPSLRNGFAYVLTFATIEDQSFSHSVHISRVNLADGTDELLAEIGFDRETDDSTVLFQYPELAVTTTDLWVIKEQFGSSEPAELIQLDAESGEVKQRIAVERPGNLMAGEDSVHLWTSSGLGVVDPKTGEIEILLEAGTTLEEIIGDGVDAAAAFVTESADPLTGDDLAFALRSSIDGSSVGASLGSSGNPLRYMAMGEGAVWINWNALSGTFSGETVLGEGVLRFNLESRRVDAIIPTAQFGDHFLGGNSVSNGGGDLTWSSDALWLSDPQSNGAILRVDPSTLIAELVYEPCEADIDCSDQDDVLFNRTDPEGLWVEFARLEDQGDGNSSGELFLVELDSADGQLEQEIPFVSLFQ